MSKVDRAATQAPLKLIAPNRPRALEGVKAPSTPPTSAFSTQAAKAGPGLHGATGPHVSRSAQPDALWGDAPAKEPLDAQLSAML